MQDTETGIVSKNYEGPCPNPLCEEGSVGDKIDPACKICGGSGWVGAAAEPPVDGVVEKSQEEAMDEAFKPLTVNNITAMLLQASPKDLTVIRQKAQKALEKGDEKVTVIVEIAGNLVEVQALPLRRTINNIRKVGGYAKPAVA